MLKKIYATDAFNNMKIVYEFISYAGFRVFANKIKNILKPFEEK